MAIGADPLSINEEPVSMAFVVASSETCVGLETLNLCRFGLRMIPVTIMLALRR